MMVSAACSAYGPAAVTARPEVPAAGGLRFAVGRRRRAASPGTLRSGAAAGAPNRSTERPSNDIDHFIDVLVRSPLLDRRANTALNVILQDDNRQRVHRGAKGRRLLEDVDAVFLAFDHP